jgi:hypothetical protein
MKKVSKRILDKINLINEMLPSVNGCSNYAYTYNGGTYPHQISIKPITVKNQFVTITNNGGTFIDNKERFNVNKTDSLDEFGSVYLNVTLKAILKAFVQLLKEEQKTILNEN